MKKKMPRIFPTEKKVEEPKKEDTMFQNWLGLFFSPSSYSSQQKKGEDIDDIGATNAFAFMPMITSIIGISMILAVGFMVLNAVKEQVASTMIHISWIPLMVFVGMAVAVSALVFRCRIEEI